MYGDRDDPYRALARLGQRLESTIEPSGSRRSSWTARGGPATAVRRSRARPAGCRGARGRSRTTRPGPRRTAARPRRRGGRAIAPRAAGRDSASRPPTCAARRPCPAGRRGGPRAQLTSTTSRSREQLVIAREEERRRLRRDLHDGLGPTLAAIGMRREARGRAARPRIRRGAARSSTSSGARRAQALADVRRLVDDLRPPALDELGLVGAIRQQALAATATTPAPGRCGDRGSSSRADRLPRACRRRSRSRPTGSPSRR